MIAINGFIRMTQEMNVGQELVKYPNIVKIAPASLDEKHD